MGARGRKVAPPESGVRLPEGTDGRECPSCPMGIAQGPTASSARTCLWGPSRSGGHASHTVFGRLIAAFVVIPLVELVILLQVAEWVGLLSTVVLVVATGILGAALARRQGLRAWLAVQDDLAHGRLPGGAVTDGLSVLLGGAFLLTPGILTDIVGFSLLVPTTRRWLAEGAIRVLQRRTSMGVASFTVHGPGGEELRHRADLHTSAGEGMDERDPQGPTR